MPLPINANPPRIMHVDLNACFARAEQQAWSLWRGKPVGVTPVAVPGGAVISPSYELKSLGVKTGTRNRDARLLAPDAILKRSDPALHREIHRRFVRVFRDFSPDVVPKSIDEAVIDFSGTPALERRTMEELGTAVKERVRAEVGDWMRVNVGIGPNRFLAKLAAGLHKPDGLDRIDHANLRDVYARLTLLDLPGINVRYQSRLNASGIYTPLEFLDADPHLLHREVFQSVVGQYWHRRLRGYEVDDAGHERASYANSVQLERPVASRRVLLQIVYKLTHKMAARMRSDGHSCRTVGLTLRLGDGGHFQARRTLSAPASPTRELFRELSYLFDRQEMATARVRDAEGRWRDEQTVKRSAVKAVVWCGGLEAVGAVQGRLFDDEQAKGRRLSDAEDAINARYGPYAIGSSLLLGLDDYVVDRIPFGSPRDLEELYDEERAFPVPDGWAA